MNFENDEQKIKRLSKILSTVENETGKPDKEFIDKLREQSTSIFLESCETNRNKQKTTSFIWRIIMKNKISKLLTAAAIIIAVLIAIHYLGGSIDGSGVAWADVMEQMSSFRPYASTHTVYDEGRPTWGFRVMRINLTQRRQIFPDGRIAVYDLGNAKSLTLYPEEKRAIEQDLTISPGATDPDVYAITRSMQDMSYGTGGVQELGEKEIEGHLTKGFRSKNEYNDITVWADVKTKLPVQLEVIHVGRGRKIIINEFDFDVDFDESLFSTTAPEGYTVEKNTREEIEKWLEMTRNNTEENLVEGLRSLAVILDGTFPPGIELTSMQTAVRGYVAEKNLSDSEAEELLTPFVESITRAYSYMNQLQGMGVTFNYVGEGVKLGDSEAPIMWWLPQDSATYRVIYGDLRVDDVAPENLPK